MKQIVNGGIENRLRQSVDVIPHRNLISLNDDQPMTITTGNFTK